MTFTDWVAAGAAIGVKAFFAVLVLALCVCTMLGLLAALARMFGGNGNDMDRH